MWGTEHADGAARFRAHAEALVERAAQAASTHDEAVGATVRAAARVFHTGYVELRGEEIAHMARYADVLRRSARPGSRRPSTARPYDAAVDLPITALMTAPPARLESRPSRRCACSTSTASPSRCRPTASGTTDWPHNRIKRLIEDPIVLRSARVGLGEGAPSSGLRRSRAASAHDGYVLRRSAERPWSVLAYLQGGTNEVFVDIATALYLGDERIGSLACIVPADRVLG